MPFLSQVIANQTGYSETLFGALQTGNFDSISDIPQGIAQNFLNVFHTLTDTSVSLDTSNLIGDFDLPPVTSILGALLGGGTGFHDLLRGVIDGAVGNVGLNLGLPVALAVDAIGAPYFGVNALMDSSTAFTDAVQAGDPSTAFSTLFTAPATISDAFLNGQGVPLDTLLNTLGIPLNDLLGGLNLDLGSIGVPGGTANLGDLALSGVNGSIPLGGLLAPLGHIELGAMLDYSGGEVIFNTIGRCPFCYTPPPINIGPDSFPISTEVTGTPIGGLIPGLLNYAPQQLANAITGTMPGSWSDIATEFQQLPTYLSDQFQLTSLFGPEGWLGLLGSTTGLGDITALFDGLLGPTAALGDITALFDPAAITDFSTTVTDLLSVF